jgi:hypothetical protein
MIMGKAHIHSWRSGSIQQRARRQAKAHLSRWITQGKIKGVKVVHPTHDHGEGPYSFTKIGIDPTKGTKASESTSFKTNNTRKDQRCESSAPYSWSWGRPIFSHEGCHWSDRGHEGKQKHIFGKQLQMNHKSHRKVPGMNVLVIWGLIFTLGALSVNMESDPNYPSMADWLLHAI